MQAYLFLVLAFFVADSIQGDRPFFAPYGPENGDATLFRNDDQFTDGVLLIGGMNFFNVTHTFLYVDNNGIITLDSQLSTYTPSSLATIGVAAIAPYWADVDTRASNGGFVYYRSTLDTTLAASVSSFVRATNPGLNFVGTRTFVASWIDVGYYFEHEDKLDTFQCVLIADDLGKTFAIFNYGDIQWTTGDASGGSDGLGGVPAAVGFTKGDGSGVYAQVAASLTGNIINIGQGSNCAINGVPQIGQYIYSVSDGASVASCCSTSNPPVLSGTPTQLNFTIDNINDVPSFTGTVTATYQCTSPVQATVTPVIFSVFGCPVTRTWSATDACFKTTSVQQTFTYPEVFSEPLELTIPADYTAAGLNICNNPVAPDPSVSGTATSNRGADATITYQDSNWVQNSGSCTLTRFWQAEDICDVFQRAGQVITYNIQTAPLTTDAVTSQQLTTQQLTTQPLTTQPLTTQPLTTHPLTTTFATVADRCLTYSWPETQGWFCSADQTGYYQCLKGPWASQAVFQLCPPGTSCKCAVGVECSIYGVCTLI